MRALRASKMRSQRIFRAILPGRMTEELRCSLCGTPPGGMNPAGIKVSPTLYRPDFCAHGLLCSECYRVHETVCQEERRGWEQQRSA